MERIKGDVMAYNGEKQCFECDCCGKKIPSSKVVQLCAKCEKMLEESIKEDYSTDCTDEEMEYGE